MAIADRYGNIYVVEVRSHLQLNVCPISIKIPTMNWHSLRNWNQSEVNEISADVLLPPESPWFNGHFPGEPILPGVAQLGMVFDTIKQARKQKLKISSIRRVRFKHVIRPDDQIKIVATSLEKNDGCYSFRILLEKEPVCSGIMTVENQLEPEQ